MLRDPYVQVTAALAILVCSLVLQALVQPYESTLLNVLDVGSLLVLVLTQIISIVYLYLDSLDENQLPLEMDQSGLEITVTLALSIVNVAVIATLFAAWIVRFGYEKLQAAALMFKARAKTKARDDTGLRPPGALRPSTGIEMQELNLYRQGEGSTVSRNPIQFHEMGDGEDGGAGAGADDSEGSLRSAHARAIALLQEENALLKEQNARLKTDRRTNRVEEIDAGAAVTLPFQMPRVEPDAPLPGDWSAHMDDNGIAFYFSEVLQITQWTRP